MLLIIVQYHAILCNMYNIMLIKENAANNVRQNKDVSDNGVLGVCVIQSVWGEAGEESNLMSGMAEADGQISTNKKLDTKKLDGKKRDEKRRKRYRFCG